MLPVAISQQSMSYRILSQVSPKLTHFLKLFSMQAELGRSRWLRGLMRGSATFSLLGLRIQIPLWAWMSSFVSIMCQVAVFATGRSFVQRTPTECDVSKWVWSRNFNNEEALDHSGLLRQKKNMNRYTLCISPECVAEFVKLVIIIHYDQTF